MTIQIVRHILAKALWGVLNRRVAAIVLMPILAACSVEVDQGGPRPGRPQAVCTMEYAPVCGERGRQTQTFGNACQASSQGFRIIGPGECRPEPDVQVCTREYAPVCGQRGRDRQTFANACEARSEGFRVIDRGECRREPVREPISEPEQQICTQQYAPVCARRGRDERTFGNACEAQSQNFRIVYPGECR